MSTTPNTNLTPEEIQADENASLKLIAAEFKRGFDFLKKYDKKVSFFGSSRLNQNDRHCAEIRTLAGRIAKELGYAVITGGGPGIMESANRGAFEAGGNSLGITIKLDEEQITNPYVNDSADFSYFFVRKTMLTFAAEAFIFSPGGFGTLDEFFDILTLVQTRKIPRIPLILIGSDFWKPLDSYIKEHLLKGHETINADEMSLYHITDDQDEIIDIIRKAPIQNWWKGFEIGQLGTN